MSQLFFKILFVGLIFDQSVLAAELSFDRYHTQDEINAYMKTEAQRHPEFVKYQNLGQSQERREISYLIISHVNPASVPAIYLNGTHHGDEWSSTEAILGVMDYLIANHEEAQVSKLLDSYAIYLQPLVNPDGHADSRRADSLGRDPNRDYSYPGLDDSDAFKIPEIQLVRELMESTRPIAAGTYHSGIEEVLWPWCHTENSAPQNNLLAKLAETMARAMNFDRYLQSYFDYPLAGEFIDYAYMKHGTLALTVEVSEEKTPPANNLAAIVDRSVVGAMAFLNAVDAGRSQTLDLSHVRSRGSSGTRAWPQGLRLE